MMMIVMRVHRLYRLRIYGRLANLKGEYLSAYIIGHAEVQQRRD